MIAYPRINTCRLARLISNTPSCREFISEFSDASQLQKSVRIHCWKSKILRAPPKMTKLRFFRQFFVSKINQATLTFSNSLKRLHKHLGPSGNSCNK